MENLVSTARPHTPSNAPPSSTESVTDYQSRAASPHTAAHQFYQAENLEPFNASQTSLILPAQDVLINVNFPGVYGTIGQILQHTPSYSVIPQIEPVLLFNRSQRMTAGNSSPVAGPHNALVSLRRVPRVDSLRSLNAATEAQSTTNTDAAANPPSPRVSTQSSESMRRMPSQETILGEVTTNPFSPFATRVRVANPGVVQQTVPTAPPPGYYAATAYTTDAERVHVTATAPPPPPHARPPIVNEIVNGVHAHPHVNAPPGFDPEVRPGFVLPNDHHYDDEEDDEDPGWGAEPPDYAAANPHVFGAPLPENFPANDPAMHSHRSGLGHMRSLLHHIDGLQTADNPRLRRDIARSARGHALVARSDFDASLRAAYNELEQERNMHDVSMDENARLYAGVVILTQRMQEMEGELVALRAVVGRRPRF